MPDLFNAGAGKVIALRDPTVQGLLPLAAMNPTLSYVERRSLITRVTIAQETNHQFLHTLGGDIFVYVFGDRIGQMTVSGLSVAKDCDQGTNEHGFEQILKYYKANKLSKRKDPVTVMIGRTPVSGFIAGMTGGVFDHRLYLMQWDLTLMVLPEKD